MESPEKLPGPPARVLLIEDDETDAMWIRRSLAQAQGRTFQLTHAKTLEEGLAVLDKGEADLIICDLGLPDASGLESYEAARKAAFDLPILVLTGNISDENRGREAVRRGAEDYLIKGVVTSDGLLRAIDYAVERRRILLLKDRFVHMVSHELRNPLAALREVTAQLLELHAENLTPLQKELIELAQSCIARLLRTTSDLLDVAKMESGRASLQITAFDLVELVKELCRLFEKNVSRKGLALEPRFPEKPVLIHGDRDAIARCITNLLNNAVKYTEKGFIKVEIAETPGHGLCRVSDSGIGIAAEHIPKIFNRYEQFGKPAISAEKGVGLGLSICKEIAERHGGSIQVESVLGQGSVFTVQLPQEGPARKTGPSLV
ncbi:MAG: sensor histidine kinase [Candidatus Omnitrophota bacterium]